MAGQPFVPPASNPQVPNQPYASPAPNPQVPGQSYVASNPQIQPGMQVVGSDMGSIGQVRDVRENDFLIDLPMKRDVYAPFNAIQNVDDGQVVLNIPANQVSNMNWPNPPLMY